jgi:hypothetical protein
MIGDSKRQFIVDEKGNRTAVVLDIKLYEELVEAWEDLDDIRAFDEAEAEGGEEIPFEQAVREIEEVRRKTEEES